MCIVRDSRNLFKALIYTAHRAVIFAIAQHSCSIYSLSQLTVIFIVDSAEYVVRASRFVCSSENTQNSSMKTCGMWKNFHIRDKIVK